MTLNETNSTYIHQPSLRVEKHTLTIENDSTFDESPTESLKTKTITPKQNQHVHLHGLIDW